MRREYARAPRLGSAGPPVMACGCSGGRGDSHKVVEVGMGGLDVGQCGEGDRRQDDTYCHGGEGPRHHSGRRAWLASHDDRQRRGASAESGRRHRCQQLPAGEDEPPGRQRERPAPRRRQRRHGMRGREPGAGQSRSRSAVSPRSRDWPTSPPAPVRRLGPRCRYRLAGTTATRAGATPRVVSTKKPSSSPTHGAPPATSRAGHGGAAGRPAHSPNPPPRLPDGSPR